MSLKSALDICDKPSQPTVHLVVSDRAVRLPPTSCPLRLWCRWRTQRDVELLALLLHSDHQCFTGSERFTSAKLQSASCRGYDENADSVITSASQCREGGFVPSGAYEIEP